MTDEAEPTHEEVEQRRAAIEPWVEFMVDMEGSEVGDYWRGLSEVIDLAESAQEYGHAGQMVAMLEGLVENAKAEATHGGWVEDMVQQQQWGHERWAKQFTPEALEALNRKSPKDRLAGLLAG